MATEPTPEQLKNRETAAAGGTVTETPVGNQGGTTMTAGLGDELLKQIQSQLLGNTAVSSETDPLTESVQNAISGIGKGQEASAKRIESAAGRAAEELTTAGTQKLTAAQESQRGFATNTALIKSITADTEKSLKDLEQRKQELLLAGEADAAGKIAELQLKKIEFAENAKQRAFTNQLSLAGLGIQITAKEEAKKQFESSFAFQKEQQKYNEKKDMANIAAEWGVKVLAGDTLESIVNKVAPLATKKINAELAKLVEKKKEEDTLLNLDQTMAELIAEGATPEQAAMTALNQVVSSTGIKVDAKQLENSRTRAVALKTKYDEEQAKIKAKEETSQANFFGKFMNAVNPAVAHSKEQESIANKQRAAYGLPPLEKSKDPVETFFGNIFGY